MTHTRTDSSVSRTSTAPASRSSGRLLTLGVPLAIAVAVALAAACGSSDAARHDAATGGADGASTAAAVGADVTYDAHGDPVGLHRYHRWTERVRQGAQPAGEEAFRNLAALGVRTVISVDGARPDAETAARHGLRYVHVPIGYHGVTREQALRIAKAAQTSDGPVYVHCHHGKHRGPAGAMVVLMTFEGVDHATAVRDLRESGCSEKYTGLYRDTERFVVPTEAELAAVPADLPSYVAPAALVDAMVDVDYRADTLKECQAAGWSVPASSPDVSPPHEATMLWESFREMARLDESKAHGDRFLELLAAAEAASKGLETALAGGDAAAADAAYGRVRETCGTCHEAYRNNR